MKINACSTSWFLNTAPSITFIALLLMPLAGCGGADNPPSLASAATGQDATCAQPIRVLLLADMTTSGAHYGVELPGRDDLAEITKIVANCTGEVAFGTVESAPRSPLIRLRIDAPEQNSTEPEREDFSDPFQYNNALAAYRRDAAKIEVAEGKRQERIAQEERDFLDQVESVLAAGATHQSTDLNGAIRRMNVFHEESTASWPHEPEKYALLVTDGKQTVIGSHFELLPKNVNVLVVYGSSDMGELAKIEPTPLRFESVEAAIHFIKSQEVQ